MKTLSDNPAKSGPLVPSTSGAKISHHHLSVRMVWYIYICNTRAKRVRMGKVSIFKIAVANANFTTRTPFFELKSNFISMQNFKAGNVKPPGMHWSKDF